MLTTNILISSQPITITICLFIQLLQDRADKICEMAGVMNQSIQIDEERYAKEQELMSRLLTENKVFLPINSVQFVVGINAGASCLLPFEIIFRGFERCLKFPQKMVLEQTH